MLGKQLELFTINPMVGSGLVMWLPKGASFATVLENFVRDELTRRGYQGVYTPNVGRVELYETSGHYPYYADSMFTPIVMEEDEQYILKPMNCPHHVMIYKSKPRSYRELPIRLAEFGTVYRYEKSGELSGMTRVRGFTQDDAHIFCTEEQVADEFRGCIEMTQFVLQSLDWTNIECGWGSAIQTATNMWGTSRAGSRLRNPGRRLPETGHWPPNRNWARRLFTGRRPILWSPTASDGNGSWGPCSWTTICRANSVLIWNISEPIISPTAP